MRKSQLCFLVLSALILVGLMGYSYIKTNPSFNFSGIISGAEITEAENNGVNPDNIPLDSGNKLVVFLTDTGLKIQNVMNDLVGNFKAGRELKKAEEEAKKDAEVYLENGNASADNEGQAENETTLNEENSSSAVYLPSPDYVPPYEITIPEGMKIPKLVDDIEFRPVSFYVYAKEYVRLYDSPVLEGNDILTCGLWEEFLCVGISKDCCYQLISPVGELVYADGTLFFRHREDMPVTEDIKVDNSVELSIEYISQFPTLPLGAEVTSLSMVLSYYGYHASKDTIASDYLAKGKVGYTSFYEAYVGNPGNRNSYGCYSPVIVKAANDFLLDYENVLKKEQEAELEEGADSESVSLSEAEVEKEQEELPKLVVTDMTGCSFEDVLLKVGEGIPVIVWTAADLDKEPVISMEWIVNGEYLTWKDNMHCVVVIGYDSSAGTVRVADPTKGYLDQNINLFIKRFKQFYSQAIAIEPEKEDTLSD